jgi:transporter family-2 protein
MLSKVKRTVLLIIPIVAGLSIALQNVFYDKISKNVGLMGTVVAVHLFGLIFALIFFLFNKYTFTDIAKNINIYMIVSGLLGVIVVSGIAKSVGVNGVVTTVMLTIIAQMLLSKIIGHFGWFGVEQNPINWMQVLAIGLMISGVILYQKN